MLNIYSMPLLKNIGTGGTGRKGWKLVMCSVCKVKCYETPQARILKANGYKGMCTECMLKAHMRTKDNKKRNDEQIKQE